MILFCEFFFRPITINIVQLTGTMALERSNGTPTRGHLLGKPQRISSFFLPQKFLHQHRRVHLFVLLHVARIYNLGIGVNLKLEDADT